MKIIRLLATTQRVTGMTYRIMLTSILIVRLLQSIKRK